MPTNFETMKSDTMGSDGAMDTQDRSGPGDMGSGSMGLQRTGNGGGEGIEEGETTKQVERVTAKAPSMTFLILAGTAMLGSLALFLSGKRETGIFVGLWPLAMLSVGNYNKMVKLLGSDRQERDAHAV